MSTKLYCCHCISLSLSVYIYIHSIYTCVYIYICVSISLYIHIYIQIPESHLYIFTYIQILYVHIYVYKSNILTCPILYTECLPERDAPHSYCSSQNSPQGRIPKANDMKCVKERPLHAQSAIMDTSFAGEADQNGTKSSVHAPLRIHNGDEISWLSSDRWWTRLDHDPQKTIGSCLYTTSTSGLQSRIQIYVYIYVYNFFSCLLFLYIYIYRFLYIYRAAQYEYIYSAYFYLHLSVHMFVDVFVHIIRICMS